MTKLELVTAADVQLMQGLAQRVTVARPDLVSPGSGFGVRPPGQLKIAEISARSSSARSRVSASRTACHCAALLGETIGAVTSG
jgi:hypothetical protein